MNTFALSFARDPRTGRVRGGWLRKVILGAALAGLFGIPILRSEAGPLNTTVASRLQDLADQPVSLKFGQDVKAVVFLFVSVECPISNSYAPEFKRLGAQFGPKGVEFRLIYPNLDESVQAIKQHVKEFELPFPVWRDPSRDLIKKARVRTTPEAAVLVPSAGFVYHGRIDNRYADLGVARPQATERDLMEVLTAIIEGKPVPRSSAKAIGCSISPPP